MGAGPLSGPAPDSAAGGEAEFSLLCFGEDVNAPRAVRLGALELVWFASMGPEKGASEDAFFVRALPGDRVAAGVVDGMGGMVGGAAAARIGATRIHEALDGADGSGLRPALVTGIERAHAEVLARVAGGGATVAALSLSREHCQFVHAGDAEGIHLSAAGQLRQRTVPHSPVGYAQASGVLTESEALAHPDRNLVASGLGVRGMTAQVGSREPLLHGDTVVLATDGLTDNVFEAEILAALRDDGLEEGVASLVELARARMKDPIPGPEGFTIGKPDDLTVLALRRGC